MTKTPTLKNTLILSLGSTGQDISRSYWGELQKHFPDRQLSTIQFLHLAERAATSLVPEEPDWHEVPLTLAIDQGLLNYKTPGADVAPPVTKNVTYERILDARSEPHNWLTYYGAYDGQRYSPLDQINTENVKRLLPAWVFQAGTTGLIAGASTYSFEASPIVVDGIMFVTGWDGWLRV